MPVVTTLEAQVSNVSTTAFITLYARALESQRPNPILSDPGAVQLAETLRPMLAASDRALCRKLADDDLPSLLIATMALRGRRMDAYARDFLARHEGGTVVNLGCGLDTRFQRIDDGRVVVVDLDLPPMIALKRTLLAEGPRYHFLAASVLDFAWMNSLPALAPPPYLFIAEGLFMYLPADDVRSLVVTLRRRFPGSELVCEVFNSFWLRPRMKRIVDRKLKRQFAFGDDNTFQSGLDDSDSMEAWDTGIRLLDEWSYFDDGEPKLGALNLMRHVPLLRKTQWTVHYALGDDESVRG